MPPELGMRSAYYNSTHYAFPRGPQATPRRPWRCYHVLAHGNRCATIFYDDAGSCAHLERSRRRDGVALYVYVLMPNITQCSCLPLLMNLQRQVAGMALRIGLHDAVRRQT